MQNKMMPDNATERKAIPLFSGLLKYFPRALIEVAKVSRAGNEQHHPGQPLHWDKGKSTDEADALLRHLIEAEEFDDDGQRHKAKVAWRALALLERELDQYWKEEPDIDIDTGEEVTSRPWRSLLPGQIVKLTAFDLQMRYRLEVQSVETDPPGIRAKWFQTVYPGGWLGHRIKGGFFEKIKDVQVVFK